MRAAEYSLFHRALLQKRPIILRSLLIVATTYTYIHAMKYSCTRMQICAQQNIVSFIGLFCKRDYNFKEPTNRSHTIYIYTHNEVHMYTNANMRAAEYSLFYRALLQKRPIILRSLLIVATPYTYIHTMKYSRTRMQICAHIYTYTRTYTHADVQAHLNTHTDTDTDTYMHICTVHLNSIFQTKHVQYKCMNPYRYV